MVDIDSERFRMFVENANDIFYTLTLEGTFTYVSPNWTELLGHEAGEVIDKNFSSFVHSEDMPLCQALQQRIVATGKKQAGIVYRIRHKDGAYRWHEARVLPLTHEAGEVAAIMVVASDVTEKQALEEELFESNERLENFLLELPVAIMIVDYNTRHILEINPRAMLMLGCTSEQLVGRKCTECVCPTAEGQCPIIDMGMEADQSEREAITASGERIPIHKSAITMELDNKTVILECFTDISRMKAMERQLQEMARTDELTGLSNRRYFMEQARKELARAGRYGHPVAMLSFDIDHFKDINDRYGHPEGDEMLRAISRICRDTLRETDTLGRLGGEEFGVLLPECDIEAAGMVAERLRKKVAAHVCRFGEKAVGCTISLGGAQYAGPEEDLESLMKRTDKALYQAKNSGRNCLRLSERGPGA